MITRRCIFRQFLLTPGAVVNDVMLYLLAALANRHGVEVHAFCAMSSHIHLVCTDVKGKLPAFMTDFMAFSARALNAFHGRRGCFWEPERSYDRLVLLDEDAELESLAYVHTNPVNAGLVEKHDLWPGATTRPCVAGPYELQFRKPNHFFRDESWPAEVVLRVTPPPFLRGFDEQEVGRGSHGRLAFTTPGRRARRRSSRRRAPSSWGSSPDRSASGPCS